MLTFLTSTDTMYPLTQSFTYIHGPHPASPRTVSAVYWSSKCTVFLRRNYCPRRPLSQLSAEPTPYGATGGPRRSRWSRLPTSRRRGQNKPPFCTRAGAPQTLSKCAGPRFYISGAQKFPKSLRLPFSTSDKSAAFWDRGSEVAFPPWKRKAGHAGWDH